MQRSPPIDAKKEAEKQDSHVCDTELGVYLQISQVGILVSIYNLLMNMIGELCL